MSLRDVLFLGWKGPLPPCNGFESRPVVLAGLGAEVARAGKGRGAVLVLGDGVLDSTPPRAVLGVARWPFCIPVLVPRTAPLDVVLRWRDAGIREVHAQGDLALHLHALAETPLRVQVDPEAWAPRDLQCSVEGDCLLRLVPHLEDLTVHAWAKEAGRSERALREDCRIRFRVPPRAILWAYMDASYKEGRKTGRTIAELARALGFFDESNLRRAYRVRKREFPG